MEPRSNRYRRPAAFWLAPALATVFGLTATSAQAGGHHRRVVVVPVESVSTVAVADPAPPTRVIYREVIRTREAPAPAKEVTREPAPATPQYPEKDAKGYDDDRPTRTVVVERYVYRDPEPETVRVRTIRVVPVQTYVVREVQAAPTYVIVKPKHHFFGH